MAYACIKGGSLPRTLHSWNNTCHVAGSCGVYLCCTISTCVLKYAGAFTFVMLNMSPILIVLLYKPGFKAKHSTDMCIYAFKEAVLKYRSLNSNVYSCFLDASKAFDRVNHCSI